VRIGIVTDEISPDIREAIALGVSWGIRDFEFRTCRSGRIPFISETDLQTLRDCKDEFGVNITALSPGTFKTTVGETDSVRKELNEILPRTMHLAHQLGAPLVITFGFLRSGGSDANEFDRVVEVFRAAASLAEQEDLMLAVENEPGFWADTGMNTAKLLRTVNSEYLRANWDPANALGAEAFPYPTGYAALKDWIVNLHVKDAEKDSTLECVPVGQGKIKWEDQLRAVLRDGKLTHITIETHCLPLIENSRKNVETVARLLKKIEQEEARTVRE